MLNNIEDYIKMGKIGKSFVTDERVVLLIDEIDKADTDFQDDMLDVLDQMQFDIIETDKTISAKNRPVIIIMLTVPLALIGVVVGLLVARSYFGFMTFLGVIALIGIVINNARMHEQALHQKEVLRTAVITFHRCHGFRHRVLAFRCYALEHT